MDRAPGQGRTREEVPEGEPVTVILALSTRIAKGKLGVPWFWWLCAILFDFWALHRIILKVTA